MRPMKYFGALKRYVDTMYFVHTPIFLSKVNLEQEHFNLIVSIWNGTEDASKLHRIRTKEYIIKLFSRLACIFLFEAH